MPNKFKVGDKVTHPSWKKTIFGVIALGQNNYGTYSTLKPLESDDGLNTRDQFSYYDKELTLVAPLTEEEIKEKKKQELIGKITRLWERQAWVKDGKPAATFYTTQPAQSVENKATTGMEITWPSTLTSTHTVSGADMVQQNQQITWFNQQMSLEQLAGLTNPLRGPVQSLINLSNGYDYT